MTREEAVARIKDHIELHRYRERNAIKIIEALDMAIKALEQPEIIRCKDCKNSQGEEYWIHRNRVTWWNGKEDFCSKAEREEE